MWKKILVGGAVGAAVLGAGGTALAASGGSSPAPPPTTTSSPKATGQHPKAHKDVRAVLRRTVQATWVTRDKGTFVTHDAIRGVVTAAGPSITVKAADGTSETYVVNAATKVHHRGDKTSTAPVQQGDRVAVLGTGTSTLTATQILDAGPAPAPRS